MRTGTHAHIRPISPTRAQERSAPQRRIIGDVFRRAERPLSIDEVLDAARRGHHGVSFSTVYRFVRVLVADGALSVFELPGLGMFYELAGKKHSSSLLLRRCRRVDELNGCISIDTLALRKDFRAVSHDLAVSGVCCRLQRRRHIARAVRDTSMIERLTPLARVREIRDLVCRKSGELAKELLRTVP